MHPVSALDSHSTCRPLQPTCPANSSLHHPARGSRRSYRARSNCALLRRQQLQQHRCNITYWYQRHTLVLCSAAVPDWEFEFDKNPQNTQNPLVVPSPALSPVEAATVQLQAISNNDHPWENHGVQTMYEFAEDCGSMERSRYFGFSKDLYHLDHFLGAIKTACGALVDCKSFTILPGPPEDPLKPLDPLPAGSQAVYVAVQDSKGAEAGVFELRMVQREQGLKAGCWMTKSCLRVK